MITFHKGKDYSYTRGQMRKTSSWLYGTEPFPSLSISSYCSVVGTKYKYFPCESIEGFTKAVKTKKGGYRIVTTSEKEDENIHVFQVQGRHHLKVVEENCDVLYSRTVRWLKSYSIYYLIVRFKDRNTDLFMESNTKRYYYCDLNHCLVDEKDLWRYKK